LLKAIDECNSLNAAAKKLSMSYRAAWGRLKASERRMGCHLVEHHQGKQMRLTARGKALVERFDQLQEKVSVLLRDMEKEFSEFDGEEETSRPPKNNSE
jgi:molybdate transport system regulatory protein